MSQRKSLKRTKVTITLPKYLLEALDELAVAVETSRSDVVESFVEYGLDHEDIVDELFPPVEEEEGESEEDESEEEPEIVEEEFEED